MKISKSKITINDSPVLSKIIWNVGSITSYKASPEITIEKFIIIITKNKINMNYLEHTIYVSLFFNSFIKIFQEYRWLSKKNKNYLKTDNYFTLFLSLPSI
jgi:hypothetical protein